jgi:hypothetical protein
VKTTRPKSLLPDADVVIETYKLGVWEQLIAEIPVLVPATIAYSEALFYKGRKRSVSKEIDLPALVEQGKIRQVEASAQEVEAVLKRFDCISRESLHPGEVEALAVFYARKAPECAFCSGDKTAIRCLAMLGLSDCAISLEGVLDSIGLRKNLRVQFTKEYLRAQIKIGQQQRITGLGLAVNDF